MQNSQVDFYESVLDDKAFHNDEKTVEINNNSTCRVHAFSHKFPVFRQLGKGSALRRR